MAIPTEPIRSIPRPPERIEARDGTDPALDAIRADEVRARTAETLRLALLAAELGTWEWDPATDRITLSDRAAEIYGLQPGKEYLREWMRGLLSPDHREQAREKAAQAVADRADYDIEYPLTTPAGQKRWVSARGRGVYDAGGNLIRMLGVVQDITARKDAEMALRETEARFRRLTSAGIIGVIHWDLDRSLILDANDEFLRMTGYDRADVEAGRLDFRAMTPPEWTARNEAGIRELRETGVGGAYEKEYFRKDGSRVAVIIVGVRFEGASPEGMSLVLDITERKRMEEELAASRDQTEIILRGVADGITVQDHFGRLLFANDGAAVLTGFPSAEALVDTPGPELMRRFELLDESGKPFELANLPGRRALAGEERPEAVIKFRVADTGEERWSLVRSTPVRDAQGAVKFAVNIFHDITHRKRAEDTQKFLAEVGIALAGSLDYQTTLASVARLCVPGLADWCAIDILEEGGTLKRLAVAHTDPEKVRWGHEIHSRFPPDPQAPHGLYKVIRTGQAELHTDITDEKLVAAARDPEHLQILRELGMTSVMIVPLRARGRVLGGLSLVAAESRRRLGPADLALAEEVGRRAGLAADNARLYGEVVATDRRKDEFIALLAHELRNPLAPLRNGLQVMQLAAGDADTIAQAHAMMDRQLGHMVRLIDDLLDVSRINQNKMELRRSRVLLADVASSAVETARPAIEAAGHELIVSLPRQPIFLDADLTRLAQVFSNLLNNSAKYTQHGGRIWLTAEPRSEEVVVSVRDSGIGIPVESLDAIFDMFSQVDRSIERSTGGLGIGLALVKGLVEMHGGTVTAASAGQGKGSTFTVTLPVMHVQPGPPIKAPMAESEHAPGPKRRILVVDDNQDGAESLAMTLRLMDNEVRTAHDGIAAVEMAERFRPEIILMDVGMPLLNGLDATRRIREKSWGHNAVIIALTGWGQENDRERSREAGCDGHLVKPVNFADLAMLLREMRRKEGPPK